MFSKFIKKEMSKDKNKYKPLLSIVSKQTKPAELIAEEKVEPPIEETQPIEPSIDFEHKSEEEVEPIVEQSEVELEVVSEIEKKSEVKEYWEVVYVVDKVEKTIFTKNLLCVNQETRELEVYQPFGKLDLTENVLNRKLVSYSCVQYIELAKISIDISKGVFIKNLRMRMLRNESETVVLLRCCIRCLQKQANDFCIVTKWNSTAQINFLKEKINSCAFSKPRT
jgi:hypothetical protein